MRLSTLLPALGCLACALAAARTRADDVPPADPRACTAITADAERLACYDRAMGRAAPTAHSPLKTPPVRSPTPQTLDDQLRYARAEPLQAPTAPLSLLDSRWELSPQSKLGPFHVRAYKPVYLLPAFYTSRTNQTPSSPASGHTVARTEGLDKLESKFQLSLKTKIWQGMFGDNGDLWMGYTQTSHWQVYNSDISRPFRETNYEPEAILAFRTNYDVFGWKGRLLGVGFDHQSNGRADPLSRSWNRVVFDLGLEREGWTLMLRPWIRVPESRRNDDNPDIADYLGRGDLLLVHDWGSGHELAVMLRHSLRGGDRSHGAVQVDWAFPIHNELRGHVQIFSGYGESLIDYNHRATYLGLGVSMLEWY
ncbi:MAG: phospholipase A [Mizugakiibacter sp.]|uniref:phospholipase A n=1 Tax=Mizugakiibacter sp. TaxID=1972610 RepID=UPI0031C3C51E|nr:phospholipase A [Xanthomonadaceae bacterium]